MPEPALRAEPRLATLPAPVDTQTAQPAVAVEVNVDAQVVAAGKASYDEHCARCHGDSALRGGVLPDLRKSAIIQTADAFKSVVHDGALAAKGMLAFSAWLSAEQVEQLRQYLLTRARDAQAAHVEKKD